MKKINLSTKAKKSIIITGSALICVGAIVAALNINGNVAAAEPQSAVSSSPSTAVSVYVPPIEEQKFEVESGTSSAFVPSSGTSQTAELTKIEKPVSAPPAPSVASGTNVTDKNKKPSYSSKPTAKSNKAKTKKSENTTTKKSNNPGDNDPVFGNKGSYSTHGETTKDKPTDHDGDINKQVGIMD